MVEWRVAALIALSAILIYSLLTRWLRAYLASLRARRRARRALRGESRAETLLTKAGYQILERQLPGSWDFGCDEEELSFSLRADLLVERNGVRYIAEVKTGSQAPDLRNSATRRQLLEYALAYQSPTILLVDVERGIIHQVHFPLEGHSSAELEIAQG